MIKTRQMNDIDRSMIANLEAKTGKGLDAWLSILSKHKLAKHGDAVAFLKGEFGMGHGYADLVARHALSDGAGAQVDVVGAQYSGAKAALRPLYDELIGAVRGFGRDVEVSPKKSYVSLRRNKQFAIVQASTKTRLDVGLVLKGAEPGGRLQPSGSFNAMMTHRVGVAGPAEIDGELIDWLRAAYDAA